MVKRWISATVNERYSDDPKEGIPKLEEGDTVILEWDSKTKRTTWYKT